MVRVHCDGLCEPVNPGGIACYGWVVYRSGKTLGQGKGVAARGAGATNNVAEYHAVIAALEWLLSARLQEEPVMLVSDSQLVVFQLSGEYTVRSPLLLPLFRRTVRLMKRFRSIRVQWVPREQNELADRLSREAYATALLAGCAGKASSV